MRSEEKLTFLSSKAGTLLFETLTRKGNRVCCVGVGTAQGGILAACWASRLLLSLLLEEKPTLHTEAQQII